MNTPISKLLLGLISCFFLLIPSVASAQRVVLTMGWEQWEPFAYHNKRGKLVGIDIDIIRAIFQPAGVLIDFVEVPWARALQQLKSGKLDLLPSAMKTKEREQFASFSNPYQKETYILYVLQENRTKFSISKLEDIITESMYIGVMRDCLYGDEYDKLIKTDAFKKHIEEVTTDQQNHKKLLNNRLDGFIQESSRMNVFGRKSGILYDVAPLYTVDKTLLHMMFNKQTDPKLIDIFNKGLHRIMKTGEYQKIFKKYGVGDHNMLKIDSRDN